MRHLFTLVATIVLLIAAQLPATIHSRAGAADYAIPNGHFYTQAVAPGTQAGYGHAITDEGSDDRSHTIKFWSEFQRLGGVAKLGYPSSERFKLDGFWTQATQRVLLQWRPEVNAVYFVNVFDKLHDLGKDQQLLQASQVPLQVNDNGSFTVFDDIRKYRQSWLDGNVVIKNFYLTSVSDPVLLYGLPTSHIDTSNNAFDIIRLQRIVIQYWKVNAPGIATPGMITVALGGDIAKNMGLVPASAGAPVPGQSASVTPPVTGHAGQILFGSDYVQVGNTLQIVNPKTVFHPGEPIALVAYLSQQAGSTTLNLSVIYTAPDGESVTDTEPFTISDANITILTDKVDGTATADIDPGTYRFQLARLDGTLLAEGAFQIQP